MIGEDCAVCGQKFKEKHPLKIYCSGRCAMQAWRKKNPQYKIREAKYFQKHKKQIQERRTKQHKQRYKTDIQYKLKDLLRSRLLHALKNEWKSGSAVRDLGCSISEFKVYIESLFKPGMNWNNHGKGSDKWNLDHIRPLVIFNLAVPEQLKEACRYTNLQPMWEKDHYIKTNNDIRSLIV